MWIKEVFYGPKYGRYLIYDIALQFFDNSDTIRNEKLYADNYPPDLPSVMEFLASQGLIEETRWGVRITEAGKFRKQCGGFVRELFWERIQTLSLIVSILAGLATVIALFFSK